MNQLRCIKNSIQENTKIRITTIFLLSLLMLIVGFVFDSEASARPKNPSFITLELLGNPAYPAISYSGHRGISRSIEQTPTVEQTKSDLRILSAMGIKWIRTYNTTLFPHTERILQAIDELKNEAPFEMYVMVGAWISCKDSFSDEANHTVEDEAQNREEIEEAINMAAKYPDIVKIIAVGNEAMVTWQGHFVSSEIILKWVDVVLGARDAGRFSNQTLITCSDNWAALGGEASYRSSTLEMLLRKLDFISVHTYAFHDTYYNPELQWVPLFEEQGMSVETQINRATQRAIRTQKLQFNEVKKYVASIGLNKPIHIGETGWATLDNSYYGENGTRAANEYTAKIFYDELQKWINESGIACFYFEAFDEPWKSHGTHGSEGHFGLFTVDGKAKYAIWDVVDTGVFEGLHRDGHQIKKTHEGQSSEFMFELRPPKHVKFRP